MTIYYWVIRLPVCYDATEHIVNIIQVLLGMRKKYFGAELSMDYCLTRRKKEACDPYLSARELKERVFLNKKRRWKDCSLLTGKAIINYSFDPNASSYTYLIIRMGDQFFKSIPGMLVYKPGFKHYLYWLESCYLIGTGWRWAAYKVTNDDYVFYLKDFIANGYEIELKDIADKGGPYWKHRARNIFNKYGEWGLAHEAI